MTLMLNVGALLGCRIAPANAFAQHAMPLNQAQRRGSFCLSQGRGRDGRHVNVFGREVNRQTIENLA
jgi:hypothetical protein